MLKGSSAYSSEIFSTAGSSSPVMARASERMTLSTVRRGGLGWGILGETYTGVIGG
jgi:hypothetical protein